MSCRAPCLPVLLALIATTAVAGRAAAQTAPLDVPSALPSAADLANVRVQAGLRSLAEQLASPSYAEREQAMERLMDEPVDIAQLCAILARPDTNSEARYRLLNVVRMRLVGAPRGALGISMRPRRPDDDGPVGVEIEELVENMPAERLLKRRDRITHIDGHPLVTHRDLVIIVQTKAPGDTVMMRVARPRRDAEGHFLRDDDSHVIYDDHTFEVALGSVEQLRDPNTGLRSLPGPLDSKRQDEAAQAKRRYAPRPVRIEMDPATMPDFVVPPEPKKISDADVENHVIIQRLLIELRMIEENELVLTEDYRHGWHQQLAQVIREATDERRDPVERELLRRVAVRFGELIRP